MRVAGFDLLDLVAGLAVAVGGLVLVTGALNYPVGTLHRMGPGYLPIVTGVILAGLGAALAVGSRLVHNELPQIRLKPVVMLFAGLLWWALTVERLGLLPSTVGLVVLASLAQERPSLVMIVATAGFLAVFSLVVFLYALSVPIPPLWF